MISLDSTITIRQFITLEFVQLLVTLLIMGTIHQFRCWRQTQARRRFEKDWNEFVGSNAVMSPDQESQHG